MSLISPRIPYKTIRDALITLLRDNLTSLNTDLSTTITAATEQIKPGDPFTTTIPATLYPVILVKLISKTEDFAGLGSAGHKMATITLRTFAITRLLTSSANADDESMNLARNIEGVLRDNIQFDSNILYAQPIMTDFAVGEAEGTYVSLVSIDLACTVRIE